jgi:hypothetical protein
MDRRGLPEYFAMEAYVVRQGGEPLETTTIPTSALASWPEYPGLRNEPAIRAEPAGESI